MNSFTWIRCLIALSAAILCGRLTSAQTYYVRAGAAGTKSGSDWANAFTSLPATLQRGATYYVADGSYPGYDFTTPASGTTYISIKKAIPTDHGTDTGWQASYGAGQAVFGELTHYISGGGYIDINGQVEYGFKVDFGEGGVGLEFGNSSVNNGGPNVMLRYIDFDGITDTGTHYYNQEGRCINIWPGNAKNLLVSHCALHGQDTLMWIDGGTDGVTVEYCDLRDARSSNPAVHPNIIFIAGGNNGTIRYNKIHNYNAEGLFFSYGGQTGWKIYGNVFYDGVDSARGVELRQDFSYGSVLIDNNTFVNLPTGAILNRTGETGGHTSGCEAQNNLGFNAAFPEWGDFVTVKNNITASSDPFVASSSKDFRLKSATVNGTTLVSPYNMDMFGNTRGADGVWDVGAYEYTSGPSTNPVISLAPTSLDFGSVQVGSSADLTATVKNAGVGTLSGAASVSAPFSVILGGTYSLGGNQSQTVTIRYAPTAQGTQNGAASFTGGGGGTIGLSGSGFSVQQGLSFSADSGTISAPFTVANGIVSQNVETTPTSGGRAVYAFNITNAGSYTISASVNAADSGQNSFYINIDSDPADPTMIWDIPPTAGFQTQTVSWRGSSGTEVDDFNPKVFVLSAGQHSLIIIGREPNAQLGSPIQITLQATAPSAPQNLRIVATP